MITLEKNGVYLKNGQIVESGRGLPAPEEARKGTMAYSILSAHNKGDDKKLRIKFDALMSHDITYVGIIQTARASGLTEFPLPYAMTNCHNSLCAVGGTINEDDHIFGLSAAKKYGGIYVPVNQAVIHQYAREAMVKCGSMILGSDSHTRYGALGTMGVGEGGPELVKQLLNNTYDVNMPEVVLVWVEGEVPHGVGPHDVAISLCKAVFANGFVNNKVLEFVGPGIKNLSVDFRNGIDVMTTETTCLSSIWVTDDKVKEYYAKHGKAADFKELKPADTAYYDSMIKIDLSTQECMIALPFHPSNAFTIKEVQKNAKVMAQAFMDKGYKVVSGGTDNHCMLIDLRTKFPELTGKKAENTLVKADITINKNMVPFDSRSPFQTSGIRVGTPAITTRGLKEEDMKVIVDMIDRILSNIDDENVIAEVKKEVNTMMNPRPMFAW